MQDLFAEIRKAARNLEKNRYTKTSRLIISLAEKIDKQNGKYGLGVFTQEIGPLFDTFKNEYEANCPIGQNYRRRCFEEVSKIVMTVLGNVENEANELVAETNNFMDRMQEVKRSISPMMDLFMNLYCKPTRTNQESLIMFNSACQSYLIAVEGVFGELAKTLYYFIEVLGRNNPSYKEIKKDNIWGILRSCKQIFGISPVFLENWQEKNHIRNAIAHAQAEFSPEESKVRFFSRDLTSNFTIYDKTMSFEGFLLIHLELIDAIDSFHYAIELFRVMNLLTFAYSQKAVS